MIWVKVVGLCPFGNFGKNKLEDKEKKSGTDTKSENNPVKSDETYVQIFKCHFYLKLTFDTKNYLEK